MIIAIAILFIAVGYLLSEKFRKEEENSSGEVTYGGVGKVIDKRIEEFSKLNEESLGLIDNSLDALETSNQDQNIKLLKLTNELGKTHTHPDLEDKITANRRRADLFDVTVAEAEAAIRKVSDKLDGHTHQDLANRLLVLEQTLDTVKKEVEALSKLGFR